MTFRPTDPTRTMRSTGAGLAIAAGMFVLLALFCQLHALMAHETVPLTGSLRWATAGTSCWFALLLLGWTNRERLRTVANGPLRGQIALFAFAMLPILITDAVAMHLLALLDGDPDTLGDIGGRALSFLPRAAMLSAIMMLSLIVWERRQPAAPQWAFVPAGLWLDFPEAPLLRLRAADVRLIRSAGNYSEIVCAERTWLVRATLSDLAARFGSRGFVRVHRRTVVNARHVREINGDSGGRAVIVLTGGDRVTVGPSYRRALDALTRG